MVPWVKDTKKLTMTDILGKLRQFAMDENDASLYNMTEWYAKTPEQWPSFEEFLVAVILVQTAGKQSLQQQLIDEVARRPAWPENFVDMNS